MNDKKKAESVARKTNIGKVLIQRKKRMNKRLSEIMGKKK